MWEENNFKEGKQVTIAGDAEGIDTDAVVEKAEAMRAARQSNELQKLEEGEETAECRYLVRGAVLKCSCGSHTRKLNLPLCHGVYASGQPMIHEEDCVVGDNQNISTFGVCESEGHPDKTPLWKSFVGAMFGVTGFQKINEERKKILLQKDDGTNVRGFACTPCIVSNWKDVHATQKIARNNTEGINPCDRLAAVTEDSFLVCAYGGLIEPVASGQTQE